MHFRWNSTVRWCLYPQIMNAKDSRSSILIMFLVWFGLASQSLLFSCSGYKKIKKREILQ